MELERIKYIAVNYLVICLRIVNVLVFKINFWERSSFGFFLRGFISLFWRFFCGGFCRVIYFVCARSRVYLGFGFFRGFRVVFRRGFFRELGCIVGAAVVFFCFL